MFNAGKQDKEGIRESTKGRNRERKKTEGRNQYQLTREDKKEAMSYSVILRRVRLTIVAVEKQKVFHILSVHLSLP